MLLGTGFFAGWYWQNASVQDVVKVEIVEKSGKTEPVPVPSVQEKNLEGQDTSLDLNDCQFVGSKNSDKYHSPDSASAKRIKKENIVCFDSEEEALEEGYEAGTIK